MVREEHFYGLDELAAFCEGTGGNHCEAGWMLARMFPSADCLPVNPEAEDSCLPADEDEAYNYDLYYDESKYNAAPQYTITCTDDSDEDCPVIYIMHVHAPSLDAVDNLAYLIEGNLPSSTAKERNRKTR